MISKIKQFLYFPVASYFRFFATVRLKRWKPKIVVITGSNGKTTLLHMLEAQIGEKAKYSHLANSSFGIPFDILGLHRTTLLKSEWIGLIFQAPFAVFKKLPDEKIYVVEADCDRPGEGRFLASLLNPEIVLWVSSSKTHSMNFERIVRNKKFQTIEEAIANEFGYFLEYASDFVMINGDSALMTNQVGRTRAEVIPIKKRNVLRKYEVNKNGTFFYFTGMTVQFNYLLPEEVFYSIEMTERLCDILNINFDQTFPKFKMPPGRGTIFKGIKNITILDSSYNANFSSMEAVLSMFNKMTSEKKWVVAGDMLEQGDSEKEEHEKLAELISKYKYDKIILMGPRVGKYTYPQLRELNDGRINVVTFLGPKETLDYIIHNIKGGETILFKGARFMEGIIEHLLKDKDDIKQLPRREKVWDIRRKKWGL